MVLQVILVFQVSTVDNRPELKVNTTEVNVTQEKVSPDLSCPAPNITNNITREYEHLQNPDLDTSYSLSGDSFTVEGVDAFGELYGSSMAPGIMNEDVVLSKRFTGGLDLQEGMIIRYDKGDGRGPVVHRVVGDYQSRGFVVASGDVVDAREKVELSQISHVVVGVLYQ